MCRTMITIIALVMGLLAGTDYAAAGTDWNVWTAKGRVMAVEIETDNPTGAVVSRVVTILTGAELLFVECQTSDLDCDFSLLDTCGSINTAIGSLDFIDHTLIQKTCTSGHGECLYVRGSIDNMNGQHHLPAAITTRQALSSCSAR